MGDLAADRELALPSVGVSRAEEGDASLLVSEMPSFIFFKNSSMSLLMLGSMCFSFDPFALS